MNKLAQLFNRIEKFSIDAHFEYQISKFAAESANLIAAADNFDIKDEELFNQFESFMSGYKELMDTLKVDAENLDPEKFEDAGELVSTLRDREKRIMTNSYLRQTESEGWDEDFNPGDFLEFVYKVAEDAENKLKAAAGEDFNISDMKAAQLAKEFNQQGIDKGDKNITWTGDKVRQNLEARKRHHEKLMMLKKLNINHPEYQAYIAARRSYFKDFMESLKHDPEKANAYREKARQRQSKFNKKLVAKRDELIKLIQNTNDVAKVNKLEKELQLVQQEIHESNNKKRKLWSEVGKEHDALRNSSTFSGDLFKFKQNIANVKMGIKKTVTDKIKADLLSKELTTYKPYLDKIKDAKDRGDKEGIKQFSKELNDAINMKAINDEAELHPKIVAFVNGAAEFNNFRAFLNDIDKSKVMESNQTLPDPIKDRLLELANVGKQLIQSYQGRPSFSTLVDAVAGLVAQLNSRAQ
jgi:hypothetical protein